MIEALVFLAAAASLPACDSYEVSADHIGPLKLGDSESELRETLSQSGLPFDHGFVNMEGTEYAQFTVSLCDGGDVVATLDEDQGGTIYSLETASPKFRLPDGSHAGKTVSQLQEVYPEGEAIYGQEEGGFFVFLTGQEGLYFDFDTSELGYECLRRYQNCPEDLSGFRSSQLRLVLIPTEPE